MKHTTLQNEEIKMYIDILSCEEAAQQVRTL